VIAKKIHREPFLEVGMDLYPLVGATLGVSAARAEIPYTETLFRLRRREWRASSLDGRRVVLYRNSMIMVYRCYDQARRTVPSGFDEKWTNRRQPAPSSH